MKRNEKENEKKTNANEEKQMKTKKYLCEKQKKKSKMSHKIISFIQDHHKKVNL